MVRRDLRESVLIKPGWSSIEKYNRLVNLADAPKQSSTASASFGNITCASLHAFAQQMFAHKATPRVEMYVLGNATPNEAKDLCDLVKGTLFAAQGEDAADAKIPVPHVCF